MRRFALLTVLCLTFCAGAFAQAPNLIAAGSNPSGPGVSTPSTTPAPSTDSKPQPADTSAPPAGVPIEPPTTPAPASKPSGRVGVGIKMSLLGAGIEVATPVTQRTNVRVGFNAFSYSRNYNNDGITYAGNLSFRSFETHFDWFPFGGGFHLSPGFMAYNGNKITANAAVGASQSFSLGGTSYISDPANPVTGTGKIGFNSVAPSFLVGWGNLLPRGERHISIPFEVGFMYQGSPSAKLNLAGSVCDSTGVNCRSIASDSTVLSNIQSQQSKLNNDLSFFKVYPIISIGFGYKF